MQRLGMVLITIGLILLGWFGYQQWSGVQSVTKINEDIVKTEVSKSTPVEHQDDQTMKKKVTNPREAFETNDDQNSDGIATLVIPSVNLAFDVFMGTDQNVLARGVGMYDSQWTTTPDLGGHTVLTGHRDSVFRPVGELEHGESIYVNYDGVDYEYEINKTWITDAEDRTVIVEKDEPTLTLSTCYPFDFIGSAPDRYIIQAELIRSGDLLNLNVLNK